MCGRGSDSTNLPEPSGPFDERFVYRLTDEGEQALAVCERANGKPAFTQDPLHAGRRRGARL
ncbi:MAG TPA: hypothetical protein VLK35_21420 [Methylomirabilota bacterium]|nr:hypothetical protein [Methylomirabilota bacterium]